MACAILIGLATGCTATPQILSRLRDCFPHVKCWQTRPARIPMMARSQSLALRRRSDRTSWHRGQCQGSVAQDLTVRFTSSLPTPTVIGIDGKSVMALAQQIGEAIIPSEVVRQFFTSETFTLSVSQTSLPTPTSDFNDLEIEYTSTTVVPLTMSW
jgi:hypothetical protein